MIKPVDLALDALTNARDTRALLSHVFCKLGAGGGGGGGAGHSWGEE